VKLRHLVQRLVWGKGAEDLKADQLARTGVGGGMDAEPIATLFDL